MQIFKKTATTRLLFFVASDMLAIAIAIWLSFLIRFDGDIAPKYDVFLVKMVALAILFTIPTFYFQKLYFFSWSYVGTNEIIGLFRATTISFIFLGIAIYVSKYFPGFLDFPRSTIFISYLLVFVFCGFTRFAKRIYLNATGRQRMSEKERTLIVGAGDAAEQILRNMLTSKNSSYFPVGFVDDNPMKRGVSIHGFRVLGRVSDIARIVQAEHVKKIVIALSSANNKAIKEAVDLGRAAGVRKIKIAPALSEVMSGDVSLKNLKDVDVEDLLGRNQIELDTTLIEQFIKQKVVLITGAAGSIGSELSRQVAKFKPSALILLDQDETGIFSIAKELQEKFPGTKLESLVADITDRQRISRIFSQYKPAIVFHAAAYKHVPLMEQSPYEAVKNNIFGTEILANESLAHKVEKFIFISTDKAINPTSVMGATKRVGEMICQALSQKNGTSFISVRFGNVLNSRGSVIPIFREQIRRGGPVEVTHPDMQRYFMLTSEACLLVMQAGAMGRGGEVFVLDMGKPVKIVDLAREMIRLSGFEPDRDIAIVFIGTRPGEKLFEEIMTDEEGTIATKNQKIFISKLGQIPADGFLKHLDKLRAALDGSDKEGMRAIFKELIPAYNSEV